jgi:hydrogenase maturation protease
VEKRGANILVLGVGNLLLQDEGAGVWALARFQRKYATPEGIECLDGGTSGMELLSHIEGRDRLIILDVVKGGRPPGTVVRLEAEEVPALFRKKISPHQLGLSDLLAAATFIGKMPRELVLLGIEPKAFDTGLHLSAEIEECIETVADMVAAELASCGIAVRTRTAMPGDGGLHCLA